MKKMRLFTFITILVFLFSNTLLAETDTKMPVKKESVEKNMPSYSLSLKQMIEQAKKNIKKVDDEIRVRGNEEKAREHFDKGNQLYKSGDLAGAKEEWEKALKLTDDPKMKNYIKRQEKNEREEMEKQERAAKEKQRKLDEAKKEKEKAAREAKREAERKQKEAEKQARLEAKKKAARLKAQQKAKERAAREAKREAERKQKEAEKQARLEAKKKAAQLKAQQKAKEKAAREAKREAERKQKEAEKQARLEAKKKADEKARVMADEKKALPPPPKKAAPVAPKKVAPVRKVAPPAPKPAPKKVAPVRPAPPAPKKEDEKLSSAYKEGLSLYSQKDYDGALKKFKEVQAVDPKYSRVGFYVTSCEYIINSRARNR